jgi:hypothetical protein
VLWKQLVDDLWAEENNGDYLQTYMGRVASTSRLLITQSIQYYDSRFANPGHGTAPHYRAILFPSTAGAFEFDTSGVG